MSRTFGLVTAAALLASVTAFAQTNTPNASNAPAANAPATTAPAANAPATGAPQSGMSPGMGASNDTAGSADHMGGSSSADAGSSTDEAPAAKPHRHHHVKTAMSSHNTDNDADKLNACMADATPTTSQEDCLKAASNPS
jgi:hypothetical protein